MSNSAPTLLASGMATVVLQQHHAPLRNSPTPPPLGPSLGLNIPRSTTPIPNKHLPYCPPGPSPNATQTVTPPNSPPTKHSPAQFNSILHPPTSHQKLLNNPPIYGIEGATLSSALEQLSSKSLPDSAQVFPWLHGLHPENQIQLAFFVARKKSLRKHPRCIRAITIIKAGGDLACAKLKGAVAPDEVLSLSDSSDTGFLDCDPKDGFSVRNFAIQTAKLAQVSDIIVYGDDTTDQRIIKSVAEKTAAVQRKWKRHLEASGQCPETYNTFVLTCPFEDIEREHPELVAIDSKGDSTGQAMDFLQWERTEMCAMSKASEISPGVYLGPSPASNVLPECCDEKEFDVYIEASDHAQMPDENALTSVLETTDKPTHIAFPSSGSILPPSWSQTEVEGLLKMCRWIYAITHPALISNSSPPSSTTTNTVPQIPDSDGDIPMRDLTPRSSISLRSRRVLIHCADGYTESTLLALAYTIYASVLPVADAWLHLHCAQKRNFFAYPSDVALLTSIQDRLLSDSPAAKAKEPIPPPPPWLSRMDGSLPSRITPYMYLGNLTHANNPALLRQMGIKRILSVGEPVGWVRRVDGSGDEGTEGWEREDLCLVGGVQDNGVDPLTSEFERCLEFIGTWICDECVCLGGCSC